jgi:hypothetical protein
MRDYLLGALAVVVAILLPDPFKGSFGPLVPIGGALPDDGSTVTLANGETVTAEQFANVKIMCQGAPLNSFGPACENISWYKDASGQRFDMRTTPAVSLGPVNLPPLSGPAQSM